jgi:uncharacterized MAPEG superfamily protein
VSDNTPPHGSPLRWASPGTSQVEGLAGRMARALALRPEKIPAFVAAALAAYDEQSSDTRT